MLESYTLGQPKSECQMKDKSTSSRLIVNKKQYLVLPTLRNAGFLGPTGEIAAGKFGAVFVAADVENRKMVAIKEIEIEKGNKDALDEIDKEIKIMLTLGRTAIKHELPPSDPSKKRFYILTDLIEGKPLEITLVECMNFLDEKKHFSEDEQLRALDRLVDAFIATCEDLKRVQDHHVVHGDLHGNNVLYDEDKKQATLIDFGLSQTLDKGQNNKLVTGDLFTDMSPNIHHAPELHAKNYPDVKEPSRLYDKSTDVYALAIDFLVTTELCERDNLHAKAQEIQEDLTKLAKDMSQDPMLGAPKRNPPPRMSVDETLSRLHEIKAKIGHDLAPKAESHKRKSLHLSSDHSGKGKGKGKEKVKEQEKENKYPKPKSPGR